MSSSIVDTVEARARSASVLVTTAAHGERGGCVVTFHTQCGVDPVRYAVWIPKRDRTYDVSLAATHIAVHLLDDGCQAIEELFTVGADSVPEPFERCEWYPGPGGVPLLTTCPNYLLLERISRWDGDGAYACLIGDLVHATLSVPARAGRPRVGRRAERSDAGGDRLPGDHVDPMDPATRRCLINAAIGAGHEIDLPAMTDQQVR